MTTLKEDRRLLASFLKDVARISPPKSYRALKLLEQQYPGEPNPTEDETERKGIPDAWLYDENGWCVFIESKLLAGFSYDQLSRHRKIAERLGFNSPQAIVIGAKNFHHDVRDDAITLTWREIYAWASARRKEHSWANHLADYLEVCERKLINTDRYPEGTLTMFSGFPFGQNEPYTYPKAKHILQLAMTELRGRKDLTKEIGMDPKLDGRPAITSGKEGQVWDFLKLSAASSSTNHTDFPHLTLGITSRQAEAHITIPNSVNTKTRRAIIALEQDGFEKLMNSIVDRMPAIIALGGKPWIRGVQRRYPFQRSTPIVDAQIDFDLRTATNHTPPKTQKAWIGAAYSAFAARSGSNYQLQVGAIFPFDDAPTMKAPEAIDAIAKAWIACRPLIKAVS